MVCWSTIEVPAKADKWAGHGGWKPPPRDLVCDDVEDFAGDEDDLADGFAIEVFAHLAAGEGGGFRAFFVDVFGDHKAVAEFAVHLNDEFDLGADEGCWIVSWPGGFG